MRDAYVAWHVQHQRKPAEARRRGHVYCLFHRQPQRVRSCSGYGVDGHMGQCVPYDALQQVLKNTIVRLVLAKLSSENTLI